MINVGQLCANRRIPRPMTFSQLWQIFCSGFLVRSVLPQFPLVGGRSRAFRAANGFLRMNRFAELPSSIVATRLGANSPEIKRLKWI